MARFKLEDGALVDTDKAQASWDVPKDLAKLEEEIVE